MKIKKFVVMNRDRKYLVKRDSYYRTDKLYWYSADINKARIYNKVGHARNSIRALNANYGEKLNLIVLEVELNVVSTKNVTPTKDEEIESLKDRIKVLENMISSRTKNDIFEKIMSSKT